MIEINELVNHPIQLVEVEMVSCKLKKDENNEAFKNNNVKVGLKSWGKLSDKDKNIGYSYLNIKIGFEEEVQPFNIDVTYRGKCVLASNMEGDSKYLDFLETQGLKLLWPYIRVAITDITIKMNIKPIKFPTIDVLSTMKKSIKVNRE